MKKIAILAAILMMFGATSARAEDVFSDTFDGTVIDTDNKWPTESAIQGAISQNNQLYLTADSSNNAFLIKVGSSEFEMGDDVISTAVTGTWSESALKNGNYFYLNIEDGSANKLKIGYTAGTGLGYWTGSTFNSLAAYKSALPTSATNFALVIDESGWAYSENGTLVYTNASNPFDGSSSTYTLGLGLGGSSSAGAAGQTLMVDNIKVSTTMTPEPVSCALFVIGGGALALMRRRKA